MITYKRVEVQKFQDTASINNSADFSLKMVKVEGLAKGRISIMYSKLLWGKYIFNFSLIEEHVCV